jgi:hypothetical protein
LNYLFPLLLLVGVAAVLELIGSVKAVSNSDPSKVFVKIRIMARWSTLNGGLAVSPETRLGARFILGNRFSGDVGRLSEV